MLQRLKFLIVVSLQTKEDNRQHQIGD